jgi:threonine dehydrogenase-like Zn-dependent dehydrogenase
MAEAGGAITINFEKESVVERLNELTQRNGPQKCVDAVGMEAHPTATLDAIYDRLKQAVMAETDRPHVLREMMYVSQPGGVLSVPGFYAGLLGKIPFGAAMNKGLTIRPSLAHVPRWSKDLLHRIAEGQLDPSFVITQNVPLDQGPEMYKVFNAKSSGPRPCSGPIPPASPHTPGPRQSSRLASTISVRCKNPWRSWSTSSF